MRWLLIAASLLLCTSIVSAQGVCGNGVREGSEQCDDGNLRNLDGCSALCKFEQNQRINQLVIQFATDSVCTANAFGSAFAGGTVRTQMQNGINASVSDGTTSILFVMRGLDD